MHVTVAESEGDTEKGKVVSAKAGAAQAVVYIIEQEHGGVKHKNKVYKKCAPHTRERKQHKGSRLGWTPEEKENTDTPDRVGTKRFLRACSTVFP